MNNKDLTIRLIQQDLKHNQLTGGLQKAGLETDLHNLEIMEIVARLMDVPKGELSDQWTKTYISFLEQAVEHHISDRAEELLPLAEECYQLLDACQNIENRISE